MKKIIKSLVRDIYYKYYAQNLLYELQIRARNESVDYIQEKMKSALIFDSQKGLMAHALENCIRGGHYLEFGVATGRTVNMISSLLKEEATVFGFDTFEGLPENWFGHSAVVGDFKQKRLPKVAKNVELIKGLFSETLPEFSKSIHNGVSFCHIDSDLYSSAKTVLDTIGTHLVSGSYVLFDEYFNYPAWKSHEWKAWKEFCDENHVKYSYEGYTATGGCVLVRIE